MDSNNNAISSVSFETMKGSKASLNDYRGKVVMVVNVASKCGLTPQYEGLEELYRKYHEKGLEILAFPANNFMGQEPGTNEEIQDFCKSTYDVSFPLFKKTSVLGKDIHPLYTALTKGQPQAKSDNDNDFEKKLSGHGVKRENSADVLWNFEKFLIDQNGKIVDRFAPDMEPTSKTIIDKIEGLLAK